MPDLTFGQSIGVEPLPSQLALREISKELAAQLFACFYFDMGIEKEFSGFEEHLRKEWRVIMNSWYIGYEHMPADQLSTEFDNNVAFVKNIIFSRNYVKIFNFIQFVCRSSSCPKEIISGVTQVLIDCRAAYRLIDKTIVPIAAEAEAEAVAHAMSVAAAHPAQGPRTHLRASAEKLSGGDWGGAIRESIHAVEAAAKVVEPYASELGPALSRLEKRAAINPAMKRAFGALYGFSSDEKGIRHSLVYDEKANVTEADAMFMFGACAAFVSYLLSQQ
ncbi:hypothetical protein CP98_01294 [Sphingobium yanoikuyae]|uniref:HEPN AbiJ-N-terminal domain-containing protein n=1 Tax=Sphingobium yanoikuyae TaxID=13690 RepID=A0A084EQ47_SPHYA|nr:hypothetical protein [Sphingobium yanoikuyae]KEZ20089.1 hypothetical protein CP98_01294 [Sphingobium yanoikuyae]